MLLNKFREKVGGKHLNKKMYLSMVLLAIFVVGILSAAVPARANVEVTSIKINQPNKVVPGGAIELEIVDFSATGAYTYFYLSKDADTETSSGDVLLAKMSTTDVKDELITEGDDLITLGVPTTISAAKYWAKVADSSKVPGAQVVVSSNKVEVVTEKLPTITVDPTSDTIWADGVSGTEVDVDGADIPSDYWDETVELYWVEYEVTDVITNPIATDTVVKGEFSLEDVPIPEVLSTMGKHKILVLLTTGTTTLGTYVEFEIEPSIEMVDPDMTATFSIEAAALGDEASFILHGFPEGTIDADTIKFLVKDFKTGSLLESITATHDETDVDENGMSVQIDCSDVDEPPKGAVDLQFKVDDETVTMPEMFYSSKTEAAGRFVAKMDVDSGKMGDDVCFSAISLPAGVDVDVYFGDYSVSELEGVALPVSDVNGGWTYTFELKGMTADEYTVKVKDETNAKSVTVGTFKVLVSVKFYKAGEKVTSAYVEDELVIKGWAFPLDAKFKTVVVGTGKFDYDDYIEVDADAQWNVLEEEVMEVPHTSGGGKSVTVTIKGKDVDGKAISVEASITIKPKIFYTQFLESDGSWNDDPEVGYIFAGNPMNFTGYGWLTDEAVSVKLIDPETLDIIATPTITSGGTADSDGDLEVIWNVPVTKEFAKTKTWDVKVAGATATNKKTVEDWMDVVPNDEENAKVFFNIQPDGELKTKVTVGQEVKIVGVGFGETGETSATVTIEAAGKEIKDVDAKYGWFETTITIPTKKGHETDGDWILYTVDVTGEVTTAYSIEFKIKCKVTLSPSSASVGATVTAAGTGFAEDEDVDINWPDLPTLVTETSESDGTWNKTFTVPKVPPGTYTITFDAEYLPGEADVQDDPTVTFGVLGPLKIVSLSLPTDVYNGSSVLITVNVQDYFGMALSGASVTGSVTPPGAAAVSLTFTETAAGIYSATYKVPVDAKEGSYLVSVKASKTEAGGEATASGTFYVTIKVPPPPPVDITKIVQAVAAVTSDVAKLSGSVSTLAGDVSGLKTSVAALSTALADLKKSVAAIPIIPVELIYGILILSVIAAIAAIASVIYMTRKIA